MLDFPIDPELRIRGRPELVLQRTNEALNFVRRTAASMSSRAWQDVLARFEAIQDEWSAIEAVVHLELQLESEGRLIDEKQLSIPSIKSTLRQLDRGSVGNNCLQRS